MLVLKDNHFESLNEYVNISSWKKEREVLCKSKKCKTHLYIAECEGKLHASAFPIC